MKHKIDRYVNIANVVLFTKNTNCLSLGGVGASGAGATTEFSLNGAELSLNSGNSENLRNH